MYWRIYRTKMPSPLGRRYPLSVFAASVTLLATWWALHAGLGLEAGTGASMFPRAIALAAGYAVLLWVITLAARQASLHRRRAPGLVVTTESSKSAPLVSIGLPVFNGMPYLPDALASLLDQDEPNIEIILSDNASQDATEEYCRAVASRDSRVRYVRHEVNRGAAANFQYVLSVSTAPYFAWAAHDDAYSRSFVSTCLSVLKAHPESALCVPAHRRIDETGTVISIRREPPDLASPDLATRLRAHLWRTRLAHDLRTMAQGDLRSNWDSAAYLGK